MELPEEPGRFKAGEETESTRAEELTEGIQCAWIPSTRCFPLEEAKDGAGGHGAALTRRKPRIGNSATDQRLMRYATRQAYAP